MTYVYRLRAGRGGASWRHVKEVMQAAGKRTLFVDGKVTNLCENVHKSVALHRARCFTLKIERFIFFFR